MCLVATYNRTYSSKRDIVAWTIKKKVDAFDLNIPKLHKPAYYSIFQDSYCMYLGELQPEVVIKSKIYFYCRNKNNKFFKEYRYHQGYHAFQSFEEAKSFLCSGILSTKDYCIVKAIYPAFCDYARGTFTTAGYNKNHSFKAMVGSTIKLIEEVKI